MVREKPPNAKPPVRRQRSREVCVDTKRPYKSFRYKANTAWSSARRGTLSASGKPNIVVGSPPEFKGEPDIWAPEELLVGGSVNTCMMLTFLTLAQAKGLTPVRYESEAEGLLETCDIRRDVRQYFPLLAAPTLAQPFR